MSYLTAAMIVLICAAGAAVASWIVSRVVSLEARLNHYAVGSQVFLQLGVMFAVLLAFVFSEVWGEYNTADQAINGECGALHGAAMLANALPDAAGKPVNRAIVIYAKAVVEQEWPLMAQRRRSDEAAQDFRVAFDLASRLHSTSPSDVAIQGQILALLSEAHGFRETRTFQVSKSLPSAMWAVLSLLSIFLIGFVLFAGLEGPGHMLFASAFTGCTVMVLVLVRLLDFPFEGALTLSNADFVKVMGEVSSMVAGG
jgi:Protein of unknown function (DUF4239)